MGELAVRALDATTWDLFAGLAERHNAVWGGCWCVYFHPDCAEKRVSAEGNRALKERLVRDGLAHAALVVDGDEAVAWCQFGRPDELPEIQHRRDDEKALVDLPDWRITCFFVDRRSRRQGTRRAAGRGLSGSADLVSRCDHVGATVRSMTQWFLPFGRS